MRQVKDLEDLRALARKPNCEILLALNYGGISRKSISIENDKWVVYNHIDDTRQVLTDKQLWSKSNIGAWLDAGAIWVNVTH